MIPEESCAGRHGQESVPCHSREAPNSLRLGKSTQIDPATAAKPISMPPSARTLAVIGCTGFIGRRIGAQLLARGDCVLALVRPSSRRRADLPAGVEVVETGLETNDARLTAALQRADAVVYAAGAVRGRTLADFLPANVQGVSAVAEVLARETRPRQLVLLSSLAAAAPELSHYAQSKRRGELVLAAAPAALPWVVLRPTAVYGPGDRELRPVFDLMRRGWMFAPGAVEQRLSFIEVDDVVRAVLAALDHAAAANHGIFALDDGRPGGYDRTALARSLRPEGRMRCVPVPRGLLAGIAQLNLGLAQLCGYAPMLTPGKVREITHPAWLGDNAPFTAATGWTPQSDLATGTRTLFG